MGYRIPIGIVWIWQPQHHGGWGDGKHSLHREHQHWDPCIVEWRRSWIPNWRSMLHLQISEGIIKHTYKFRGSEFEFNIRVLLRVYMNMESQCSKKKPSRFRSSKEQAKECYWILTCLYTEKPHVQCMVNMCIKHVWKKNKSCMLKQKWNEQVKHVSLKQKKETACKQ